MLQSTSQDQALLHPPLYLASLLPCPPPLASSKLSPQSPPSIKHTSPAPDLLPGIQLKNTSIAVHSPPVSVCFYGMSLTGSSLRFDAYLIHLCFSVTPTQYLDKMQLSVHFVEGVFPIWRSLARLSCDYLLQFPFRTPPSETWHRNSLMLPHEEEGRGCPEMAPEQVPVAIPPGHSCLVPEIEKAIQCLEYFCSFQFLCQMKLNSP